MPVYIVLLSKAIRKVPVINQVLNFKILGFEIHGTLYMWLVLGDLFNVIGVLDI